jgi:hypothetical protein
MFYKTIKNQAISIFNTRFLIVRKYRWLHQTTHADPVMTLSLNLLGLDHLLNAQYYPTLSYGSLPPKAHKVPGAGTQ